MAKKMTKKERKSIKGMNAITPFHAHKGHQPAQFTLLPDGTAIQTAPGIPYVNIKNFI